MRRISVLKDKDLMSDTGGVTKTRNYGQHKRPPRIQQRDNFRKRYLDKEEKKDLCADMDLIVAENGQVYVNDQNDKHNIYKSVSDYVGLPDSMKNYDVKLQDSLNKDMNLNDIQIDEQNKSDFAEISNFDDLYFDDFQEYDIDDEIEVATDEQEESNPFDGLFDDTTQQQTEQTVEQQKTQQQTEQTEQTVEQQKTQQQTEQTVEQENTNDPIDEYLNMQIDDSKLSEQNKKKLDSFTSEQLDAFKKFLYENKVKSQEE